MINLRGRVTPPTPKKDNRTMKKIIEEFAVNTDNATQGKPCDDEKKFAEQKTPYVSILDLLKDMSVVEPSNNGGRIHRLGFIEIIEDENAEVVDTEGMSPEELEDLRTWEIEKAADEGRLIIHEIDLTDEQAKRLGISFCDPCHRSELPYSISIPCSLRPASRPNKKNKGFPRFNNFFL